MEIKLDTIWDWLRLIIGLGMILFLIIQTFMIVDSEVNKKRNFMDKYKNKILNNKNELVNT